jgi:Helicase conserved C-terminal domain
MTYTEADIPQFRAQLNREFHQLPPLEEKIIQLLSVFYEPISRTLLLESLNFIGARDSNYKSFVSSTLRPYIEGLLAKNLIVQSSINALQCHPLLVETVTRSAVKAQCFTAMAEAVRQKQPVRTSSSGIRYFDRTGEFIREARIGIYLQDVNFLNKQIENYEKHSSIRNKISTEDIFERVCNNPFDADWFCTLPQDLYESAISCLLSKSLLKCSSAEDVYEMLDEECSNSGERASDFMQLIFTEQLLLRGCLEEAQQALERLSSDYQENAQVFWGWLYFLRGENQKAIEHYKIGLKALRKVQRKQKIYFNTIGGLFFILALLKSGTHEGLREAEEYATSISSQQNHWLRSIYWALKIVLQFQRGDIAKKQLIVESDIDSLSEGNSLETLFCCLCLYWLDVDEAKKRLPYLLQPLYKEAMASNYHWLAMESAELLSRLKPRSNYVTQAEILREYSHIQTVVDLIKPQEAWELSLNALINLNSPLDATPEKIGSEMRLAWFVTYYNSYKFVIQPKEQKVSNKGVWGKGRPIALKRLSNSLSEFDYITPQDKRVCACIKAYHDGSSYYGKTDYILNEKAMSALIGHPYVFWEDAPTTRVDIVKGEPELIVKKNHPNRLTLALSPKFPLSGNIIATKETPTRIKVIEITAEHRKIAAILGEENKLEVPVAASEKVLAAINSVALLVTVHSDIGGGLENVQAEAGTKHLLVLAEIMKLRRACCNPKLVMQTEAISSSKLQLFGEVLNNLLENHHKALVFSQFVDHLQIIREYLDEQKINYQYLDGSTTATERKKRVDAFQSGDGDVFLISLKAGGTGLNLTAADYVIHMDPWWNPAVEDQASDRAHRIGQQRPVTIYRLVAKDTIEDKIVDLHHHKRDLADSLLEGAEISGKMSTEELLNLMG